MVSVSVRYLFYQPVDEKVKTWPLRFPAEETPNMGKTLFEWQIVLLLDVKSKYRLISRKFSGVKFFHPSLNQPKPMATPFRIRSINQSKRGTLYFLSFVVSVLFARFHFKVVRKSLYYPITSPLGKQNIKA